MRFLTLNTLGVCLACISISFSAMADGNIANGQAKSASCAACHGATGKATNTLYPNLAGQSEAYLGAALHAYKDGGRSGGQAGIMQAFTSGLSDQDISDLSAYYASKH